MTANPKTPHPVQLSDSNATTWTALRVYNRTTGESEKVRFNADDVTVYDLANLTSGYSEGDVISFSIHGKNEGSNTYTVTGSSGKVTITTAASAAPGVSI